MEESFLAAPENMLLEKMRLSTNYGSKALTY
jgi:hypothetical protein